MIARAMEVVMWGGVGSLLGLGLAAVPGAFLDDYSYMLWQPIGAAAGALMGAAWVWRRWRRFFRAQQGLPR